MQIIKNALKTMGLVDKIECETFELNNTYDVDEKYKQIANEMKLAGQDAFIKSCGDNVIPFPCLAESDLRVWSTFCPTKQDIKEYQLTVIPFDILQFLKKIPEQMFDNIEIWSEAKEVIDPIVVGVRTDEVQRSWGKSNETKRFLIARWGESLKPFHEIKEICAKKLTNERNATLKKFAKQIDNALQEVDSGVIDYLNGTGGGHFNSPALYI